jgi:hypothetical protein
VLAAGVPLVIELNPKLLELAGQIDELPIRLARHYSTCSTCATARPPSSRSSASQT